jgi:phosphohistidine phosphatase
MFSDGGHCLAEIIILHNRAGYIPFKSHHYPECQRRFWLGKRLKKSMRCLLLMRHAKAERGSPGLSDFDRVLKPRGRADAKTIGAYLARHHWLPDHAAVSTAARTRETWTRAADAFGQVPSASFEDRLYGTSPEDILDVIRRTSGDIGRLLVIGHNPALQELAAMLVASGDVDARERLGRDFPTSALAIISFAIESWSGVHARGGRLEHFITPRWLAAAGD